MAPLTRSAGKGRGQRDMQSKKNVPGKKHIESNKKVKSKQKVDVENKTCLFLELPSEIRNRIYDYAEEKIFKVDDSFDQAPPVLTKPKSPAKKTPLFSARGFFALTQTCKQIRAEFRPLWLRQSSVSIKWEDFRSFLDTFYPMTDEYLNAPKLLVVTWDHTPYDDVLIDLTPLLQLRAHCSTFTVKFMPDVMRDDWITDEECYACGHNLSDDCDSCCCDMHEEILQERIGDVLVAYSYTRALNDFFANSNTDWLQELREKEGDIIVECAVDCEGFEVPSPTIFIRFSPSIGPAFFDKEDMYQSALDLLEDKGMLDGPYCHRLNFVVGRATGKITRSYEGCRSAVPLYEQVHICGHSAMDYHMDLKSISSSESGIVSD